MGSASFIGEAIPQVILGVTIFCVILYIFLREPSRHENSEHKEISAAPTKQSSFNETSNFSAANHATSLVSSQPKPYDSDLFIRRHWEGATLQTLAAEFDCSVRMAASRLQRVGIELSEMNREPDPPKKVRATRKKSTNSSNELVKIEELLKSQAITQSEYEIMKARLKD